MIYNMRRRKKKVSLKWYFNPYPSIQKNYTYTAKFTSNGRTFDFLRTKTPSWLGGIEYGDKDLVYLTTNKTWSHEAYRMVEFEKEPTGELLTFLQANATPL